MKFKKYLIQNEGYEIFGFERPQKHKKIDSDPENENPINRFRMDYLLGLLEGSKLGEKESKKIFFNRVKWGEGAGAVQVRFGTKFDIIIERQAYDLKGEPIWITKKTFNINDNDLVGKEEAIAYELMQAIEQANEGPIDGPDPNFKDFEKLVRHIAIGVGKVVNDPLFFEETRKLSNDEYIIKFGCRGSGVQAPDQRRVEQVQVHIKYHPKRGMIQVIETNIESTLTRHDWVIMPSDHEFNFMPSQSKNEIVDSISTVMKYF